jgi:hypothetical protein
LLKQYDLGDDAIQFIRSQLALGRGLARSLSELPVERGRVTTHLPANVSTENLSDFGSGGIASGEETQWLAGFISDFLAAQASRVCVLEHASAERSDSKQPDVPFFTVGEDLFMFAHQTTPRETLLTITQKGHWYPAIGTLSRLPADQPQLPERSEQTPALLRELAEATDYMLIGAYDAEAWLIWTR